MAQRLGELLSEIGVIKSWESAMQTILVSEINHVAFIKLRRPEVKNAFNDSMILELTELFEKINLRNDIRAIGLQGEGSVFCAGADLNYMKSMVNFDFSQNKIDAIKLNKMFDAQKKLELPIIGYVHGAAFGGALGLIANCDYVVCEEGTQFCFSEVRLGIAPAVISPYVLKKASAQIKYYMISADIFKSDMALKVGLVDFVANKDLAQKEFERVLQHYHKLSPNAVRETKKLLRSLDSENSTDIIDQTTTLIAKLRVSEDGQEGIKSFLEKRKAKYEI